MSLYKQYDGYPEGLGKKLLFFIQKKLWVNGIPFGKEKEVFNGINDFTIQLVCYLKEYQRDAGGIYAISEEQKEEFNYEIRQVKNQIFFSCLEEPEMYMEFGLEGD